MFESAADTSPTPWITWLIVASFVAGICAAIFLRSADSFVKPAVAVLMMGAGLVLLSPYATSRPVNEHQSRLRRHISIYGGAHVIAGIALLLPGMWSTAALSLAALVMGAAALTFPKSSARNRPQGVE
jgi:hypothetical protein